MMVAYGFRTMFVEPIRRGAKCQTIRAPRFGRVRHARVGEAIQLYVGLRTRHCRKIVEPDPICGSVNHIRLVLAANRLTRVVIGGEDQDPDAVAVHDGFGSAQEMAAFWRRHHPQAVESGVFVGVLIGWHPRTGPPGSEPADTPSLPAKVEVV